VRVTTQGSGGGALSRWRPAEIFGGGSFDAAAILQLFFKKKVFLSIILAYISDEKRVLCLNKVC